MCVDMGFHTVGKGVHEMGGSQGVHKKGGSREPCDPPGYGPDETLPYRDFTIPLHELCLDC